MGRRLLLKTTLSSAVFVFFVLKLFPLSACSKKKWVLNFNVLRRARHIYLNAVAHPESYCAYLVGKVILLLVCPHKMERISKKRYKKCRSYPVNWCSDLRDFTLLRSVGFFFLSDDVSSNENASYSKGFINVDSELLLVYWVFKLQILYSKACFTRQALLERFMATVT